MNRRAFVLGVLALFGSASINAQRAPAPPAKAELINLNTATEAQLTSLPGIGPKTASLIVQYRQKNGPFKKIEEIMNVRGIGEKSFLKLKELITVAPAKPDAPSGSARLG